MTVFKQNVYMTPAKWCDQGMSKTLGLADLVLEEFKNDHSHVINIYGKSDNSGSYHGNSDAGTLYKICKYINILSIDIFDTTEELEEHILQNNHSFSKIHISMDKVKSKFIAKMILQLLTILAIEHKQQNFSNTILLSTF